MRVSWVKGTWFEKAYMHHLPPAYVQGEIAEGVFGIRKTGTSWRAVHVQTGMFVGSTKTGKVCKQMVEHFLRIAPTEYWQNIKEPLTRENAKPEDVKIFEECAKIRREYK